MSKETDKDVLPINYLPNEIISMILINNDCREIVYFGSTCKRFNEMVNSDQFLWKDKFKSTLPQDVFEIVDRHCDGDWLSQIKGYFELKQQLNSELISMSPQYYWRSKDINLEDVRNFFTIALSNNLSCYYTIIILQQIVQRAKKSIDEFKCKKPFTMTEMHYAKVVLCHLIHIYLAVKWVKAHARNELTPEVVINFFLQWIDTEHLHSDEDVEDKINELEKKVEIILGKNDSSKQTSGKSSNREKCTKGEISERKVLDAVTQVIYHQRHMAVTSAANLDTLNIVKVLNNKCGNIIVVAAIYQAVARRFGVKCELIAFPNHLFLEWRDNGDFRSPQDYTIDISTGELHPKRRCPFSQNNPNSNYKYYPDSLLQYIYSSFHMSMAAIKNWNTQNALHLLDFLGTYDNAYNPYRNFLPYLLDLIHLPAMNTPLNLKYLSHGHLQIMSSLSQLNAAIQTTSRPFIVKRHESCVRYAVGMICYHKKYDYVCVVRGWELSCDADWQSRQRRTEIESLKLGPTQPFYNVIAADQSERYVAQENLNDVARPTRLYHLEDIIAREFTHFDGFSYIPNDQKKAEYPDDSPICSVFRNFCMLRTNINYN